MAKQVIDINIFFTSISPVDGGIKINEVASIGVQLKNISRDSIWITGVLDGSETGQRFPRYLPRITGPVDMSTQMEWSDFTTPLRQKHFRLLKPGEVFDPTNGGPFFPLIAFENIMFAIPGRYSFSLLMSTMSKTDEEWLGTLPDAEQASLLSLVSQVPRFTLESNILELNVF